MAHYPPEVLVTGSAEYLTQSCSTCYNLCLKTPMAQIRGIRDSAGHDGALNVVLFLKLTKLVMYMIKQMEHTLAQSRQCVAYLL